MKRLAQALDAARQSRSRIGKEEALAEGFAAIAEDGPGPGAALATAVRFATGRPLPVGDPRAVGVGGALVLEVAARASGFSPALVRTCARRAGDLGEAFGLLVARDASSWVRPGLTFAELAAAFDALASDGGRGSKRDRLEALFERATPLETKYVAKVLLGSLRVGAQGGVVEGAIARAFGRPLEEVRRAVALATDPGVVAVLAFEGRLAEARLEPGRPVAYMLATPIETLASPPEAALFVVEDKLDGVRAQVHKAGGEVSVFARGLERVTSAFPEVAAAFRGVSGDVVLDGELMVFGEGQRPRPFQSLQPRLNRANPTAEALESAPVSFVAYDLLADDEGPHLGLPWLERRLRLEAFARERAPAAAFVLNASVPLPVDVSFEQALDVAFEAARRRGHEGLMLKRVDAPYEAGRRGQAWIKVKRAFATLDVVVTAAEEGNGRRAGTLSDYTFAVWREDELVNVGKAYSGLTDLEIDTLSKRFERATLERFGGVRLVRPEVVFEVAFDGIQRSKRHKSGFALRFPRILRIRDDKPPAEADRLGTVEALFASQVESGHREEAPAATATPKAIAVDRPANARKGKAPGATGATSRQLDLFDRKR